MGHLVFGAASLPLSFYLELALAMPIGIAVLLIAGTVQRAQQRRAYRAWRGTAPRR